MARHLAPEHGFFHKLFEASLLAKGLFAALETLTGLGLLLTSNAAIQRLADWLTRNELIEDPQDWLASKVVALAGRFNADSQHFYALYLLSHGLIKLIIIIQLARRIRFAYPLGIAVFSVFVIYQLHRWTMTHAPMMLILSAFDVMVIWLTWREWRGED